ncbi:MAG: hypothetical protein KGJ06_02980 [Pseudomonadota bacterium]|nr:hypothetical protein [Pseudomonadota bacterium]
MAEDAASIVEFSEESAELLRQLQSDGADIAAASQEQEEPRSLLRWLRNLQSTELSLEDWLELGTLPEKLAKARTLRRLVRLYLRKLAAARKERAEALAADEAIRDAGEAAAALAQGMAELAQELLPDGHPQIAELNALMDRLPPQAEQRQTQSALRLIDTISLGLDRASGKSHDLSPAERLLESSRRLQATARQLRSVDQMEPPAREESIELAREILRRLREMSFSDKPVESMIDAGRPEDKAAFAQKLEEVADIYRNLLSEAAQANPNIAQDQQVREAGGAVEVFMHAVKLMAAKEIPASISAAQQISADITQAPDEWSKLSSRAVGRLIKSMEGGLEKAVGDLQAQEQQQQQAEEQAQEAAAEALAQANASHRRKRKRRSGSQRSGKGGRKQQKEARDLTSDDYVLKQGRFARDAKSIHQPPGMPGLNPEVLATVRQLGGSLFKIGEQVKDIKAPVASVSANEKISPNDKTVAQRVLDEQKQNSKNQGPRV